MCLFVGVDFVLLLWVVFDCCLYMLVGSYVLDVSVLMLLMYELDVVVLEYLVVVECEFVVIYG